MKRNILSEVILSLLIIFLMSSNVCADDIMQVHYLDVGQADSTLITCGNHSMLIDAGDSNSDAVILNYIQNTIGLSSLDYVICTHPHEDHIGGMDQVIDSIEIGEIIMPDVTTTTQTFIDVLMAIENKQLEITVPELGDVFSLGDADFMIIAPAGTYGDELNNWSIGIKLTHGENSFVFTGDAESNAEYDIVESGLNLSADVFQVGHHGASTSNTDALLDRINPDYAVISCGADNNYGHPNRDTLERLKKRGIKIFRTDIDGNIIATSDGNDINWSFEHSDESIDYSEEKQTEIDDEKFALNNEIEVHITRTGSKYHSEGCQYLNSSDIIVTLQEALDYGLTACSKCNPPS